MLFTREAWQGIADGTITVTFRTWSSRRVVPGRDYHVVPGIIHVDAVERVRVGDIGEDDAAAAGTDLDALRKRLGLGDDEEVWRVDFRFIGPDPRIALRELVPVGEELDQLVTRLERMDRRAPDGPWTGTVLATIASSPGVAAPELAGRVGLETQDFKRRVRRLKDIGLTESLRVGYRISPRGAAVLAALEETA